MLQVFYIALRMFMVVPLTTGHGDVSDYGPRGLDVNPIGLADPGSRPIYYLSKMPFIC